MLNALRILILRLRHRSCHIASDVHAVDVELGGQNALSPGVKVYNSSLGRYSYVNFNSVMANTTVGKFTSIGPGCVIGLGNHPTEMIGSTSAVIYHRGVFRDTSIYDGDERVTIGNDVWIGANVTVINGITIGDGAIVAANSVVTTDIKPYTIVGGAPARVIRQRFTPEQICKLLELRWWDKDDKWIRENIHKFDSIEKLVQ